MTEDDAKNILRQPYERVIVPEDDGSFFAQIKEFPGCYATGETPAEALSMLEDVATSWIIGSDEAGLSIPQPLVEPEYSGKLALRLSKSLHREAARMAEREGVSLNHFMVSCIAQHVGFQSGVRARAAAGVVIYASTQSFQTARSAPGCNVMTPVANRSPWRLVEIAHG